VDVPYRTRTELIPGPPGNPGLQFQGGLVVNASSGPAAAPAPNQCCVVDCTMAGQPTVTLPSPSSGSPAAFDGCYVVLCDYKGASALNPIRVLASGVTVGAGLVPAGTTVLIAWPTGPMPLAPAASMTIASQGAVVWLAYIATLGLWVPAN
jgi:hypothetical protein